MTSNTVENMAVAKYLDIQSKATMQKLYNYVSRLERFQKAN